MSQGFTSHWTRNYGTSETFFPANLLA